MSVKGCNPAIRTIDARWAFNGTTMSVGSAKGSGWPAPVRRGHRGSSRLLRKRVPRAAPRSATSPSLRRLFRQVRCDEARPGEPRRRCRARARPGSRAPVRNRPVSNMKMTGGTAARSRRLVACRLTARPIMTIAAHSPPDTRLQTTMTELRHVTAHRQNPAPNACHGLCIVVCCGGRTSPRASGRQGTIGSCFYAARRSCSAAVALAGIAAVSAAPARRGLGLVRRRAAADRMGTAEHHWRSALGTTLAAAGVLCAAAAGLLCSAAARGAYYAPPPRYFFYYRGY